MSLASVLLQVLLRFDGDTLVMRVGDLPLIVAGARHIVLTSQPLSARVVKQVIEQMLPRPLRAEFEDVGVVRYDCPSMGHFPGEQFTVVATHAPEMCVEIRRLT
jgi:hypothetical protein